MEPDPDDLNRRVQQLSAQVDKLKAELSALHATVADLQEASGPVAAQKPKEKQRLENFIGLRVIHLVGIVAFVIGLSIAVKYAIDRQLVSPATRIILAYLAGGILLFFSLSLRKNYQAFSAILFSGALASFYFTTYAAFVYYGFFSFGLTFGLMTLFTVYAALESLRYNRQEIAILGMTGAYGIPFLISANAERADLFFSYIILINLGIVYLSFRKQWRIMAQLSLLVSWTLFILWEFFRYKPEHLSMAIVVLSLFYLLFLVSAISFRLLRQTALMHADVQQLVSNTAAAFFAAIVIGGNGSVGPHLPLVTGMFVLLIAVEATATYTFWRTEMLLLRALCVSAVVLLVIFIGANWSGLAVTLGWIVLAAALFLGGLFTHRSWPRLLSFLLMALTLGKLVIFDSSKFSTIQKIVAYLAIGVLLLVCSFLYQKFRQNIFGNRDLRA